MITVHNSQVIHNMPFEEYLQIERISHSFAKNGNKPVNINKAMHLGTQVDSYLNEHDRFDGDIKLVKSSAYALISEVTADLYLKMIKQATVFADFEYDGLIMPYKGRIDWFYPNSIVIDIKVSKDLYESLRFFKYENAMDGYCIALGIKRWMLLAVNPYKINKDTGLNQIQKISDNGISHRFWEEQVLKSHLTRPIKKYI